MTKIRNAFTVDLEDWYHGLTSTNRQPGLWPRLENRVFQNTERLLALLAEYKVKATFFVLAKVVEGYPELIRLVASSGHEIGVHGYMHRMVHRMSPGEFAAELDQALELLYPLVQKPILGHRAPYFSINSRALWALDLLRERGFQYDSSFFPTRNMLYGYPDAPRFPHLVNNGDRFVEFPVSTGRFLGITWPIAGGFYVRTLPYFVIQGAINQLNRQGQPAVLYLHPWELDIGQPMQAATVRERITHYHGRRGLEAKLRRLFQNFEFGPLCELLDYVPIGKRVGIRG